jgi:hypothetical protein
MLTPKYSVSLLGEIGMVSLANRVGTAASYNYLFDQIFIFQL